MKVCKYCQKELVRKVWQGKKRPIQETGKRWNERQFCDDSCRVQYNKTLPKEYWYKQSPITNKGHIPWNKGKFKDEVIVKQTSGYVRCIRPDRSFEYEHRKVAKKEFGNIDGLIVHHIDGDRSNNHPDNLQPMTQVEHIKLHRGTRCQQFV